MSSGHAFTLLDLPNDTLTRIAALVSEGNPYEAERDALSVTCDAASWAKLNGLRGTCKRLRRTTQRAVVGLHDVNIARRGKRPRSGEMPLLTSLSLMSLKKMVCVGGEGLPQLIRFSKNLKSFEIRNEADVYPREDQLVCRAFGAAYGCQLEVVRLSNVRFAACEALLSSLKAGLRQLCLKGCVEKTPVVSSEALSTVEDVHLCHCYNADDMLRCLALSPSLSSLTVLDCQMKNPEAARDVLTKSRIVEFTYIVKRKDDPNYVIENLLAEAKLVSLKGLFLKLGSEEDADAITRVLCALSEQLRTFELMLADLGRDWIPLIRTMKCLKNSEISLYISAQSHRSGIYRGVPLRTVCCMLKSLADLHMLCHLHIINGIIDNIAALRSLHEGCDVSPSTAVTLTLDLRSCFLAR